MVGVGQDKRGSGTQRGEGRRDGAKDVAGDNDDIAFQRGQGNGGAMRASQ